MHFFKLVRNETIYGISNIDKNETKYEKLSFSSVQNPVQNFSKQNEIQNVFRRILFTLINATIILICDVFEKFETRFIYSPLNGI